MHACMHACMQYSEQDQGKRRATLPVCFFWISHASQNLMVLALAVEAGLVVVHAALATSSSPRHLGQSIHLPGYLTTGGKLSERPFIETNSCSEARTSRTDADATPEDLRKASKMPASWLIMRK